MGKVGVTEFVSLDGVFEDPGGSEDSGLGAWTFAFDRGDDGEQFKMDETLNSDALLLGRVTYEGFAAAWPERPSDPFSDKFNGMPKYVVSATLKDPEWNNSTVIGTDLKSEVPKLKEQHEGDIAVHGSGRLARALLDDGFGGEVRAVGFAGRAGRGGT